MGFSNIVAFILLFFALIMASATVGMMYISSMNDISSAAEQKKEMDDTIGVASIYINNITFVEGPGANPDTLDVEVVNDGGIKLDLDYIDIFINEERVLRSDRTISFATGDDILNPLHFDPGEMIVITIEREIPADDYVISVTTEYGANAYVAYTVP